MTMHAFVIFALACGVLLGLWRSLRADSPARSMLRMALQCASAALLYVVLLPPMIEQPFVADTLVVLTPGLGAEQLVDAPVGMAAVALPGVMARSGVEQVPDLATALRRHPTSTRLRVIGAGLPPRDIDAARGLDVAFDAAPLPRGIVELKAPATSRAGAVWSVRGRVEGVAGGDVELRDPGGAITARSALDAAGGFALHTQAGVAGTALFGLRVTDAEGSTVETLALPLVTRAGDPLRVLLLAGAPDAELKYLRRWAVDAGIELTGRIALSDGVALHDGTATTSAEALAQTDVAIVDERAWATLDAADKTRLTDAAHDGMGLLLRITGPLDDAVEADWRQLGFRIAPADSAGMVTLEATSSDRPIALSRRLLAVDADDATPLLRAGDGAPLAWWRGHGRGRTAVWWLGDSYRLTLGGDAARFGTLWSDTLATLARARATAGPVLPSDARQDQRSVLCGLPGQAFVDLTGAPPSQQAQALPPMSQVPLVVGTQGPDRGCAGYWPAQAGWHTLVVDGQRWPFHVRDHDEAVALAAAQRADATRALVGPGEGGPVMSSQPVPMSRWPFFLSWLGSTAALWWLERRRLDPV